MQKLDEILDRLYKAIGITKNSDFCEKYDVKPNTLSTWRKRNTIPYDFIMEIAEKENISLEWLFSNKNVPMICSSETIEVNFYPEIYRAADYCKISANTISKTFQVSKSFLDEITTIRDYSKLEAIRVGGEEMKPYLLNGEYVLIEKSSDVLNGETALVNLNKNIYIGKIQKDPFNEWIKLSIENGLDESIHIEKKNFKLLSIIGIIRAKIKPF